MNDSDLIVQPGGMLTGNVQVPGDKSISHRAVMFGALADGRTRVYDCLHGEDVLATIAAFRAMGVDIVQDNAGGLVIEGVGIDGLEAPAAMIDCGNSGHIDATPDRDSGRGRHRRDLDWRCLTVRAADAARCRSAESDGGSGRDGSGWHTTAAHRAGRTPAGDRLRSAGGERAGQNPPCCWLACLPTA